MSKAKPHFGQLTMRLDVFIFGLTIYKHHKILNLSERNSFAESLTRENIKYYFKCYVEDALLIELHGN